jgi:hypothetical protein
MYSSFKDWRGISWKTDLGDLQTWQIMNEQLCTVGGQLDPCPVQGGLAPILIAFWFLRMVIDNIAPMLAVLQSLANS